MVAKISTLSLTIPSARLHFIHNIARTLPVLWLWSKCNLRVEPVPFRLHIAHLPFWLCNKKLYCVFVNPYRVLSWSFRLPLALPFADRCHALLTSLLQTLHHAWYLSRLLVWNFASGLVVLHRLQYFIAIISVIIISWDRAITRKAVFRTACP